MMIMRAGNDLGSKGQDHACQECLSMNMVSCTLLTFARWRVHYATDNAP